MSDSEYNTTMAHFYRGELARIMVWRQRLDSTTHWALVSGTGVVTLALSHREITHLVFMIANVVVFLFLIIEARRYRYYDAFRARVRVLESHFLIPVVMRKPEILQGDWRKLLSEDLALPSFKIARREAIGRRLIRNYVWFFLFILMGWMLKIGIHNEGISSVQAFFRIVGDSQPLPPPVFWVGVGVFYSIVTYYLVYGIIVRRASGAFHRRSVKPTKWKM